MTNSRKKKLVTVFLPRFSFASSVALCVIWGGLFPEEGCVCGVRARLAHLGA